MKTIVKICKTNKKSIDERNQKRIKTNLVKVKKEKIKHFADTTKRSEKPTENNYFFPFFHKFN